MRSIGMHVLAMLLMHVILTHMYQLAYTTWHFKWVTLSCPYLYLTTHIWICCLLNMLPIYMHSIYIRTVHWTCYTQPLKWYIMQRTWHDNFLLTHLVQVVEVVIWSHNLWAASVGSYHSLEMFLCSSRLQAERPPWCAADMWSSHVGWPCPLSLHTLSQCKVFLFCSSSGYLPWYQAWLEWNSMVTISWYSYIYCTNTCINTYTLPPSTPQTTDTTTQCKLHWALQ